MQTACHFNLFLEATVLGAVQAMPWFQMATQEAQMMLQVDIVNVDLLPVPHGFSSTQQTCLTVRAEMPNTVRYFAMQIAFGEMFATQKPDEIKYVFRAQPPAQS